LKKKQKSILIISYQFCPRGGVGTRRWSKFAKYLNKDYDVHVISAKYPYKDTISFCDDVKDINIHRVVARYPAYAINPKRSFSVKVVNRLLEESIYFIDYSQKWKRPLINKAKELVEEYDIRNVIVTGPPFAQIFYACKLKELLPKINLIVDYRDPWKWMQNKGTIFFKYKSKVSAKMEKLVQKNADKIIYTTHDLTEKVEKQYPEYKHKAVTIHNGYDPADSQDASSNLEEKNTVFYAGTLYGGREEGILYIVKALVLLEKESKDINIRFNIYSEHFPMPDFTREEKEVFEKYFHFYKYIPQKELFKVLNKHEYCLSINSKRFPHLIGAKTFDYMGFRKKIFHIGPDSGELKNILTSTDQIVCHFDEMNISNGLKRLLDPENRNADTQSYPNFSIVHLTNLVKNLFK